jgi:ATP-dependent DNA ligase
MPVLLGIGGVSLPITMASLSEKFQWVKPAFVCEVAFAEWTSDERLRQTTFLGWRDDNNPTEVVLEQPKRLLANLLPACSQLETRRKKHPSI